MRMGKRQRVLTLVAMQSGDALFNTFPTQWLTDDLDRMRVSQPVRTAIPIIKASSAVGLLAGLRWPRLGRLTAGALVAYFLCALGAHARVRDAAWRYVPAVGMLVFAATVTNDFS